MATGRKGCEPTSPKTGNASFRNLTKSQLGGVIFGCKNNTMRECLAKQLFGLPAQHFSYVKNINPGLPLFLFNYNDRKLYGIFEAASCGQMAIDPYGWTTDGSERTHYPAQVQIRIRLQCQPLVEEQFKPIIADNYYTHNHFRFELDHAQTSKLLSLLASLAVAPGASIPHTTAKTRTIFQAFPHVKTRREVDGLKQLASEPGVKYSNYSTRKSDSTNLDADDLLIEEEFDLKLTEQNEIDLVYKKLQALALKCGNQELSMRDGTKNSEARNDMHLEENGFAGKQTIIEEKNVERPCSSSGLEEKSGKKTCSSSDCQSIIAQLVQEMEELRTFKIEQTLRTCILEEKLVESEKQIQQLKHRCMMLDSMSNSNPPMAYISETIESLDELHLDSTKSIYLFGGNDGETWLSSLDSYFPSQDVIISKSPMSSVRSYGSVVQLYDELFIFGGGNGYLWYNTVESYNPATDKWTVRPPMIEKKGSLAGATLNEKIFAIGGGNGQECFSDVEMLDLLIGRWIPTRSMLHKRFALAAVELNGAIYVTGGYDGNDYLKTAERFDPREHSWSKIASMNTKRGCHSLVVLNEKLYALGGFDGNTTAQSTEIFDPRLGSWINGEPMNKPRGYFSATVVEEAIHVIGGVKSDGSVSDEQILIDTVEHFKEGQGWKENTTKAIGKRCYLSAFAL